MVTRKKTRSELALEKAQKELAERLQEEEPLEFEDKKLQKKYPSVFVRVKRKKPRRQGKRQLTTIDQHAGIRGLLKSSWISYLFYNDNGHVNARFNGVNYTVFDVPFSVYQRWRDGDAKCKTWDTSRLKRWRPGKSPSLGAFYDQNIKGKYKILRGLY